MLESSGKRRGYLFRKRLKDMNNYRGTIIEESLADKSVLGDINILSTKVEDVTERHQTPWLKKWTLHKVEISEDMAGAVADKISRSLDPDHQHSWYADFRNSADHYIIFKDKIFRIGRQDAEHYQAAKAYALSIGIPEYQCDFHPGIKEWER